MLVPRSVCFLSLQMAAFTFKADACSRAMTAHQSCAHVEVVFRSGSSSVKEPSRVIHLGS